MALVTTICLPRRQPVVVPDGATREPLRGAADGGVAGRSGDGSANDRRSDSGRKVQEKGRSPDVTIGWPWKSISGCQNVRTGTVAIGLVLAGAALGLVTVQYEQQQATIRARASASASPGASVIGATGTVPPTPIANATGRPLITFGTSYNAKTLALIDAGSTFKTTTPVLAFRAALDTAAEAAPLTVLLESHAASGTDSVVDKVQIAIANPTADTVTDKIPLGSITGLRSGTYILRLLRGTTVLAEGTFRLVT
jgi:hypothetical protein